MTENRFAYCHTAQQVMDEYACEYRMGQGDDVRALRDDALARIRELTPPTVSEEARERAASVVYNAMMAERLGPDVPAANRWLDRIIDALGYTPVDPPSPNSDTEPPCNPHPDAPHGFDRNSSLNEDRYVCECEGWTPPPASPSAANGMLIGPRCCYCGGSVANPGDECGMCVGSKAAQQRRGEVDTDAELTTFREPAYFDAEPDPVPASPPVVELDAAAICRVIDRAKDIIGDTDQLVFHRDDQRLTLYRNDFGLVLRIGGDQ